MTTKAAQDFIQRTSTYEPEDDGLLFKSWYDGEDVKRLILPQFLALDPQIKKEMLTPYIFFDGADNWSLDDKLAPLVDELESSDKKYYPFIFKPEVASAHYVAGFLRKNEDIEQSISIVIFNPTGTTLRIDYGDYGYHLRLVPQNDDSDDESEKSTNVIIDEIAIDNHSDIYMEISDGMLKYALLNPDIEQITNSFTQTELQEMGINIDLSIPLTIEVLNRALKPNLAKILEKTLQRGETEEKIEIISSPHKIQTIERDEGKLSSCGPISVAFISYVMEHPEYMASVDKNFLLPTFLSDLLKGSNTEYKDFIMKLRQQHYNYLQTVQDNLLVEIEPNQERVTAAILSAYDQKHTDTSSDDYDDLDISDFSLEDSDVDEESTEDHDDSPTLKSSDVHDDSPTLKSSDVHDDSPTLKSSDVHDDSPTLKSSDVHDNSPTLKSSDVYDNSPTLKSSDVYDKIDSSKNAPTNAPAEYIGKNEPENRADVQFVRQQIERYKNNAMSYFSINNKKKADAVEKALTKALDNKVQDVRLDSGVQEALAIHRIFGFFGHKKTTATKELEKNLPKPPTL